MSEDGLPRFVAWFKPNQRRRNWVDEELREDTPADIVEEFEQFKIEEAEGEYD